MQNSLRTLQGIVVLCLCITSASMAATKDTTTCFECCRPDAFAPAGVMTDHVHPKGEFSIAYGYMDMQMKGNQMGTSAMSDDKIYQNYMMSPSTMSMQMHMLMPMYGVTTRLTLMGMFMYNSNTMQMHMMPMEEMHMHGMNMSSVTMPTSSKTSGIADSKLYALYNLFKKASNSRLVLGAGVSLPTGSIMAKGETMQSKSDVLPYSMQIGTGTYNLLPSLVYVGQQNRLSWGAAFNGSIKLGVNSRNYCWGNEYSFSPWLAYKFVSWASISARAEAYTMARLYGYDAAINQSSLNDPTANSLNYGGTERVSTFIGLNLYAPCYFFKGSRIMLEYGIPAYQNVTGIQMPIKSVLTARLQIAF